MARLSCFWDIKAGRIADKIIQEAVEISWLAP